jgi:hypothetical protein
MLEDSFTITVTTAELSRVPYLALTGDGGGGAPGAASTTSLSASHVMDSRYNYIVSFSMRYQQSVAENTSTWGGEEIIQYSHACKVLLAPSIPHSKAHSHIFRVGTLDPPAWL